MSRIAFVLLGLLEALTGVAKRERCVKVQVFDISNRIETFDSKKKKDLTGVAMRPRTAYGVKRDQKGGLHFTGIH